MKLSGLVNGRVVIAANNLNDLKKKASIAAARQNESSDTLLVEGLGGRGNCPILFVRFNSIGNKGKIFHTLWEIA